MRTNPTARLAGRLAVGLTLLASAAVPAHHDNPSPSLVLADWPFSVDAEIALVPPDHADRGELRT